MLAAVALVSYLVQPGDTLSGIAASHGVSLAAVEAANPQISDPNLIRAGQRIEIPGGSPARPGPYALRRHAAPDGGGLGTPAQLNAPPRTGSTVSRPGSGASPGYSSSSLSDVPGVPQSFAACVAYRESTDLQDPAADGNAYGIMPASGYDVHGTSLAHQKQVFAQLYRQYGGRPWVSDGCTGT